MSENTEVQINLHANTHIKKIKKNVRGINVKYTNLNICCTMLKMTTNEKECTTSKYVRFCLRDKTLMFGCRNHQGQKAFSVIRHFFFNCCLYAIFKSAVVETSLNRFANKGHRQT